MMVPDYAIHEEVYARKRRDGISTGWMPTEATQRYLGWLEGWLTLHTPADGLELGCGAGEQSLWLVERGFRMAGVDISATAVEWATAKAASSGLDAGFRVGSVLELPFEDASFDFVLDGSCWHCIVGDDRPRFLHEARRVLRPGGRFIGVPMVNGSKYRGPQEYDPVKRLQYMGGVPVRYWTTPAEAVADLVAAGFVVVRTEERLADGEQVEDLLFVEAVLPRLAAHAQAERDEE